MKWFAGLEDIVKEREPLAGHNWFRVGGAARYFLRPQSQQQLQEVSRRCRANDIPIRVLGFGANLLISDQGVSAAVIRLNAPAFKELHFNGDTCFAAAGVDMQKLVFECLRRGKSGLECLTGIPGTVGGGVRMNAGGNFGDIGTCVRRVKLMDENGVVFYREKPDLAFRYRATNIRSRYILGAEFALSDEDPKRIMRRVKEIWIHKKNSQPLTSRNAGCIFKNPRGLSAGALIDKAGLKAARVGGAIVSERHANFILTDKGATAADVQGLISLIQKRVKAEYGLQLEMEIELW